MDRRTLQSMPQRGSPAGYDGGGKKSSKAHIVVDRLDHLLSLHVIPASEQDRYQVGKLAKSVQKSTGPSVEMAYVDQGYTGDDAEDMTYESGIHLEVVKLPYAKKGFVLLPRRWSLGRLNRFRRLARDYERLSTTLVEMPVLVFTILILQNSLTDLNKVHHTL